jgi:hypothetical protein
MGRRQIEETIYKNLPEDLKILTSQFEGRERDIVLLSSIGVLSNCFPNIRGLYDGDTVYPNLYVLIIAPPASGKGVMNYSRILIEKIHNKILNDTKNEFIICDENQKKKKNKEICPNIMVKILPANISSAEMYYFLDSSKHGLLIIESEADTMSNMLKNDWSNYSDVLRKAFHHEPISISRKMEKVFVDINEPKLSMVISGTPDQLQPLIKSKDNGLFSRFIVYNFDEISNFKDVFAKKSTGYKIIFENIANEIYEIYGLLSELKKPIEFKFTEKQVEKFLNRLRLIRSNIITTHSQSFLPNLHRHGLVLFRIAMILTIINNKNKLDKVKTLVCSNKDFMASMYLMKTLLRHSQFTFDTIDTGYLSFQDEQILDSLKTSFSRQDAIEQGKLLTIPIRTIDDKLVQWQKKKLVKKVKRGVYRKL